MIGDLVEVKNYGVKEVIGIKDFDGVIEISENEDSEVEIPYDDVSPIPLTLEILEKNGWVFMEGQDYSTFLVPSKWVNQSVSFALKVDGETYSIANTFTIKYVHELQNALKFCGLEELADNFNRRTENENQLQEILL